MEFNVETKNNLKTVGKFIHQAIPMGAFLFWSAAGIHLAESLEQTSINTGIILLCLLGATFSAKWWIDTDW